MSSQPPSTRYENYPPTPTEGPAGGSDPEVPTARPDLQPYAAPEVRGPEKTPRRTLLGFVVAVPLVLVGISALRANTDPSETGPSAWASSAEGEDPTDGDIGVGSYYAVLPDGWTSDELDNDTVEATNGANRLTAVSIEAATSSVAVEEIIHLAKGHHKGFSGKLGEPVDHSSAAVQRASIAATGKYLGEAARLLVELWIDGAGTGLLVARILTARPNSTISAEAQQMVDELSQDF